MMRVIGHFIDAAEQLLDAGVAPEAIAEDPIFRALTRMGEEIPEGGWEAFSALERELTATLRRLTDKAQAA
jgi:V/A-type H+-transporting ATPase subunit A